MAKTAFLRAWKACVVYLGQLLLSSTQNLPPHTLLGHQSVCGTGTPGVVPLSREVYHSTLYRIRRGFLGAKVTILRDRSARSARMSRPKTCFRCRDRSLLAYTTFLIFRPISLKFLIVTIACPGAGSVRWAAIWCADRDRVAGRASSANEKPARYPAGSGRAMFYTVTRC